ncbi:hypothetical protein [Actinomadura rupiterrae]|uniref:hypothetical protein n=1 Tax=Actinomadura rupiterrae TaxID=559627 RepID=UPI0020A2DF41|nr:hypothetical protein [Actinomadura rupiterrae]MCP2342980.1 hypothetical protein [Actinomadura rupiterrae]
MLLRLAGCTSGRSEPNGDGGCRTFNDDAGPLPQDGRPHPSYLSGLLARRMDCNLHFPTASFATRS